MASKRLINSILVLQKLYCRIVSISPKNTLKPLFKSMNILPINKLYECYCVMISLFKFYQGYSAECINIFSPRNLSCLIPSLVMSISFLFQDVGQTLPKILLGLVNQLCGTCIVLELNTNVLSRNLKIT